MLLYLSLFTVSLSIIARAPEVPGGQPATESELFDRAANIIVMESMLSIGAVPSAGEVRAALRAKLPQAEICDIALRGKMRQWGDYKITPDWMYRAIVWAADAYGDDAVDSPEALESVRQSFSGEGGGIRAFTMRRYNLHARPWMEGCIKPMRVWRLKPVGERGLAPCSTYVSTLNGAKMWHLAPEGFKVVLRWVIAVLRADLKGRVRHAVRGIDRQFWNSF